MDGKAGILIVILIVSGFLIFALQPKIKAPRFSRRRSKMSNRTQRVKICTRCGTVNTSTAGECKNHRCRENLTRARVDRLVRSRT